MKFIYKAALLICSSVFAMSVQSGVNYHRKERSLQVERFNLAAGTFKRFIKLSNCAERR